jgi:hypothetical protein
MILGRGDDVVGVEGGRCVDADPAGGVAARVGDPL